MARQVPVIRDKAAPEVEAKRSDRFATRCLHLRLPPLACLNSRVHSNLGRSAVCPR